MNNRLHQHVRAVPYWVVLFFIAFAPLALSAQQSAFSFSYTGPFTIGVGVNCTAMLQGNIGTPVVTALTPGGTVVVSQLDVAQTMYTMTDPLVIGNYPIYWYVEDNFGNNAVFQFPMPISVVDLSPPVYDLFGIDPVLTFNSIAQVPPAPNIPVLDNCTPLAMLDTTFVQTTPPALCAGGVFTRTWTATDESGNTAVFTQTITIIEDILPPQVLVAPANGSSPCADLPTAYPAWLNAQMAAFEASDPSGIASYTNDSPLPFPPGCAGNTVVEFTATDNCGLKTTSTATFFTNDTQPPVIADDANDVVAYCAPSGPPIPALSTWIQNHATTVASDACTPTGNLVWSMQINGNPVDSAGVVAAFQASFANGCGPNTIGGVNYNKVRGKVTVNFFVADACGLTTPAGQADFGAIDTIRPIVSGVTNTEQCGENNDNLALLNWVNAHGNATVTDECSGYTWTNFSWVTSLGVTGNGQFGTGPYPTVPANNCNWHVDVTFRATDDCGNIGSGTIRFEIRDTIKPVFSGLAPVALHYCPAPLPVLPNAIVTDNCDNAVSIGFTRDTLQVVCNGSYDLQVVWTATDDCGNSQSATQILQVRDTTAPFFTLFPPTINLTCDNAVPPPPLTLGNGINASDACGSIASLLSDIVSQQDPNPAVCGHYTYNFLRTYTAVDACGNTKSAVQVIAVQDLAPPVFSGFTSATAVCETTPTFPPPTATDVCSGPTPTPVLVSDVITGGPCDDSYTQTLTYQAADVCGNVGTFVRQIFFEDTIRPQLSGIPADVFVDCDNIPEPPAPGVITGTDNCDESVNIAMVQSEIRNPDTTTCEHWANYMIIRTWTVSDNCGNTRSYTQAISVQDNTGPYLEMPDTISLPNETGLCGANVLIPPPVSLYDFCSSVQRNVLLSDTVVLVASGVPVDMVPVDTVVFQWTVPMGPPLTPVTGTPVFTVFLDNADSEIASESFTILGEDDVVLGVTNPVGAPCGNGSTQVNIPSSLLNQWLTDGELVLRLAPNSLGADACNAICPGGRARGSLQYTVADQQIPITLMYSLDGAPLATFPPPASVFLDAGEHQVSYVATDCAGNSSTASVVLNIDDIEPPAIAALPNMTAYVGTVGCTAAVGLPFPDITDNCGVSGAINKASASVMLKFESNPNITDPVPTNTLLAVTGLIPNAVGNGVLRILNIGDNGETGEFFRIFDENNQLLGTTAIGSVAGQCNAVNQTIIAVSAADINQWAAGNGVANFEARANTDVLNFTNFVSPCGPLTNQMDGTSTLQAVLEYSYAVVTYEILQNNMVIQSALLTGAQTMVNLPPGQYTVRYTIPDANGTEGTVSFGLTVRDTVPPQAQCVNAIIFASPTGSNYTLLPSEINNGSSDQCSPTVDLQVTPSIFTCNMAVGPQNPYMVTLTVTDTSGNSATCTALVRVETQTFQPTASQGVCEGGSIQLMANPPAAVNQFTYKWSGPGSYMSTMANPVLNNVNLSAEGTYTVTITGITGCTAIGMTQVDLITLPMPNISASTLTPCEGNSFLLSTPPFVGSGVSYQWYSGSPGSATLLATTSMPQYTVPAQPVGNYTYYVQILGNGCSSEPSSLLNVVVQARPPAVVDQALISVCEGSPIVFGTPLTGYSYQWTGPNGYNSTLQYPPAIPSAQEIHEGLYTLIVSQNGCQSLPATVTVTVNQKPPTPLLSGTSAVCEGDMAQLTCSFPPTTGEYFWVSPQLTTTSTTINTLVLPAATVLDSGLWRVYIVQGGCQSDVSIPFLVDVDKRPEVTASYNTPLCQGMLLQLTAASNTSGLFYSWNGPNGFSSLEQSPTTNGSTGTYTVIAQTSIGCKDTATVDVLQVPLPLVIPGNNAQNCANGMQDVQLTSTVTTPYTPLMYSWTGPGPYTSTLANPIIPDVTATNNGDYTIVVTDAFGCMSLPATTTINVENTPVQPVITSPDPVLCVGESTVLQVPTVYNQGVTYTWSTPLGGQIVTNVPVLPINNATLQQAGNYTVVVETENCGSLPSATFNVQVLAAPAQPVATALPDSVCIGSPLQLSTPFVAGATYQWLGPCSYTSNLQNPVIPSAASNCTAGAYSVAITINGCTSPESEPVIVHVKPVPPTPVPLSAANVCLDNGDTLFLRINNTPTLPLAQYTWYNASNNQVMGPPTYALTYPVTDLSNLQPGNNSFYVVANFNGCNSANSPTVQVAFDTVPDNIAFAGVDFSACASQTLTLNAQLPGGNVTGRWIQVNFPTTVTFVNSANPQTTVQGTQAGNTYQFAWILSNGACKNYSDDVVEVEVVAAETAQSVAFLDTCAGTSINLMATQGQVSQGTWTQSSGQGLLQVVIEDSIDINTLVTGLTPGNTYFFFWTLPDIGCGTSTSTTTVQTYAPATKKAGSDQSICSTEDCAILAAEPISSDETSEWSSNNPELVFTNPNNVNSSVCGLQPGPNIIIFTTNDGRCGDLSRDTLIITFEPTPVARPDTVYVPNAVKKTIDVLLNDDLPDAYSVTVVEQPVHGTLEDMSDGVFSYLPDITFAGQDQFRYKICNLNCPDACSFAVVTLYVDEPGDCAIPTLFTPNNDGVNDIFVVPCLGTDGRLDNEVSIFNQWGDEVFHAQPYGNNWDGTYNGEELPAGTYYYVVKFNADGGIKTGFLVLQR